MASVLNEVGLRPIGFTALAEEDPEAFLAVLEEDIEMCEKVHGENSLEAA